MTTTSNLVVPLATSAPARVPALFISHGSPMFALDPGQTGPALQALGQRLQAPDAPPLRGVVVMSPHWMARAPLVMTHPQPETWHDFGGFPDALYQLQYPAPGSPELAQQVLQRLQATGAPAQADPQRPFDHGAWVPLLFVLPQAQLPVIQVALPAGYTPQELYALGYALRDLREQGILIVGSGSMTHNLREFASGRPPQASGAEPYVEAFSRWVEDAVQRQDSAALFNYRTLAPHAVRAHPTDEHFVTLYFALGAAGWGQPEDAPRVEYLNREVMYRYLAMDAIALH